MAGLSAYHVGELIEELAPLLQARQLRELQAQPPHDLLLILEPEGGGPILRLRLSADPVAARVHLQVGSVQRHIGPEGPFYRQAQALLAGARLTRLSQIQGDRILRLDLALGAGSSASLVVELTGRHGNLLLLDAQDRILNVLITPKEGSRAATRLATGATWQAPPGQAPDAALAKPLAEELPEPPAAPSGLAELAPLSWRVEASLGAAASRRYLDRERRDLLDRLQRRLKSTQGHLRGLEQRASATDLAERVRMDAELLTAHMHLLKNGLKSIELPDSFSPEAPLRRIELDPGLNARRNVERLFARYKKLLRSREKLPAELELARTQVRGLETMMERARSSEATLDELVAEAEAGGWLPRRQQADKHQKPEQRLCYHRFYGCRGSEIKVGRNARDNDELTFKVARGNDIWLHTSDSPGSHVILSLKKGAEPDAEEILDAALLAVHFSPLKDARKTGVHIARRKEVKKPRRAPAGLVTLSGGQTRMIRSAPERLERLLATRNKPRAGQDPSPD